MKKYKTEGNVDFFDELYKSLDEKEDTFKTEEDEDKCLITNQLLTDKFVKLECGHKFNYIPLFNDIKNHKSKFNSLECSKTMLKENEIRCPYCRKKQSSVLPYYEDLIMDKINGVNHYDISSNVSNLGCFYSQPGCQFTYNYKYSNGTTKEYGCFQKHVYNFEDGKQYCFSHHDIMKKLLIKQQNQKIKENIKKAKIEELNKVKEEKQKAKEELNKAKDEKKILKEELKKAKEELKKSKELQKKAKETQKETKKVKNVIINLENEENTIIEPLPQEVCCELLKNGSQCSKNIYLENLCKRHYNLKNKENTENTVINCEK
jgi:predicted NAD-dependent protein-ADP-ribosyltransferase YbiA (DUF1768 family)